MAVVSHVSLTPSLDESGQREIWLWDRANWTAIKEELSQIEWMTTLTGDVDNDVKILTNHILSLQHKYVPHRTYSTRPDDQPWRRDKGSATLAVTKEGGRYRLNYVLRNDGVSSDTERKKIDPFGGAKPVDTAGWRSSRVRERETKKEEKGWRVPC